LLATSCDTTEHLKACGTTVSQQFRDTLTSVIAKACQGNLRRFHEVVRILSKLGAS
jgi:hypothetical protein